MIRLHWWQLLLLLVLFLSPAGVRAATPTPPAYELFFRPPTGSGDGTGDGGGSGAPYSYQEYYVGQTFAVDIHMNTGGQKATGGDVILNVDLDYLACSVTPGTIMEGYFTDVGTYASNQILISGYFTSAAGVYFQGTGVFATLNCTVRAQRENMLATAVPLSFSFDFTPGDSTDTNIADENSQDMLTAVEDGLIYLWPDTNKPYVDTFFPAGSATGVAVNINPSFYFRDQNQTTGAETGLQLNTVNASYRVGAGTPETGTIAWTNCLGVWANLNQCQGTFTPSSKIGGNRNFSYNTDYQFCVQDGRDKAASTQTPAGPNTMTVTCSSFSTEADVDAPTLINHLPATAAVVPTTSNISFTLQDVKAGELATYGTGIDPSTIKVHLEGKKESGIAFDLTLDCSAAGVTCVLVGMPLEQAAYYAYTVTLDPSYFSVPFDHWAQNERIDVQVSGGADVVGNTMVAYSWWFKTADTTEPVLADFYPEINQAFCVTAASSSAEKLISFTITDAGVGVRPEDVLIRVGNDYYQYGGVNASRLNFLGTINAWQVTLAPLMPLVSATTPFPVEISLTDQAGNTLEPAELYALVLNCAGAMALDPNVCEADGYCNPLCLNDLDCPGGTNCQPTNTGGGSGGNCSSATTCPVSNCDGKNFESCSSCCPSVSLPTYPNQEVIYRYRDYCPDTNQATTGAVVASPAPSAAVVASKPYTFNVAAGSVAGSRTTCVAGDLCRSVWFYLPWLLAWLTSFGALHQSYRRRQLSQQLRALERTSKGQHVSK